MDELIRKIDVRKDATLKVILLENGRHDRRSRDELFEAVRAAKRRGLDVDLKTLEQQQADVDAGVFPRARARMSERKSIALSRTMLQQYLFTQAKPIHGAVAWILDDDAILEGLAYGADGRARAVEVDYVSEIKRLKETGNCVVLGSVTGEPPLPFLSCMRTQLSDLYQNLRQFQALSPEVQYPVRREENRISRLGRRDYYYDLSDVETDRLESPFWYEPSDSRATVGEALTEMLARLPDMLSGSQIFRQLVQDSQADPLSTLEPSVNRGPTTLVFDLHAMREFPNIVPEIDGEDTRRSDMIWSLLCRFAGGCNIVKSSLPIRQDRREISVANLDFDALYKDIHGYAVYSRAERRLLAQSGTKPARRQATLRTRILGYRRIRRAAGDRPLRQIPPPTFPRIRVEFSQKRRHRRLAPPSMLSKPR